jgi:D-alanyl-lipoteichoic acid acyltransferase DltB (MBOAT superfamily)
MIPQFASLRNKLRNHRNIALGLYYFAIGLIKKVLVADTFAIWAINGFDKAQQLNVLEGWLASLCYTLQLYFDFSGYMDMAMGAALLFNIRLPLNFNSPYKALSIQDFWRRWHMTLSRFLRDYLYIPLGGNRQREWRTAGNLLATFVLGGLWHGAAWTFVAWGFLHGLAATAFRLWRRSGIHLPVPVAWAATFLFINFTWVFFRAREWGDATRVLGAMLGAGAPFDAAMPLAHVGADWRTVLLVVSGIAVSALAPNSHQLAATFRPTWVRALAVGAAAGATAIYVVIDTNRVTEFIYFWF